MDIITTDRDNLKFINPFLDTLPYPAILLSKHYEIIATNSHYLEEFGEIDLNQSQFCYQVSHGYDKPCDQEGESCPLNAAIDSKHKEHVLHIHQTPRGPEHIDVELTPLLNEQGELEYFIEQFKQVPIASTNASRQKMVGASHTFNQMLENITRVSKKDASVLLLGESGTGKELAAKAIHESSKRKSNALVTLECAGLTDALFESELFGHVKGAFTGASHNKKGLVELADGGTLFLDEIGDVPLSMQVKLLRLIETRTFRPVGSAEVKASDFRLICATHKDLYTMVRQGEFREDLYFRINVFPIHLPSLSDRQEDIQLLAPAILAQFDLGSDFSFTESAMKLLCSHHYTGNIRELRNLLSRAIIFTDTNLIEASAIQKAIELDSLAEQEPQTEINSNPTWVDLKTAESHYLKKLMAAYDDDKDKVAEVAGISVRSLYRKLNEL